MSETKTVPAVKVAVKTNISELQEKVQQVVRLVEEIKNFKLEVTLEPQ